MYSLSVRWTWVVLKDNNTSFLLRISSRIDALQFMFALMILIAKMSRMFACHGRKDLPQHPNDARVDGSSVGYHTDAESLYKIG